LADVLDAELGGTRVAVEEGWIPYERQIGQTGQTVRPELYIACGISGAIQHRAGILDSRYIAAINRDPDATIFNVADFKMVGDMKKIVPALIQNIRDRRAEGA
jgi:electron transfer flavoprotein alpha subunit